MVMFHTTPGSYLRWGTSEGLGSEPRPWSSLDSGIIKEINGKMWWYSMEHHSGWWVLIVLVSSPRNSSPFYSPVSYVKRLANVISWRRDFFASPDFKKNKQSNGLIYFHTTWHLHAWYCGTVGGPHLSIAGMHHMVHHWRGGQLGHVTRLQRLFSCHGNGVLGESETAPGTGILRREHIEG